LDNNGTAVIAILLVFGLSILSAMKDRIDLKEWGLVGDQCKRVLSIDRLSSGRSANIVSPTKGKWSPNQASPTKVKWSPNQARGTFRVGTISWIENLVINRTIVNEGGKTGFSLSRRGLDPYEWNTVSGEWKYAEAWNRVSGAWKYVDVKPVQMVRYSTRKV
jgi:hypothetical protein